MYDTETRKLSYTNAGHLPPVYIFGETVKQLETGGMVVGLFDGVPFEQGTLIVEPGSILIAYSDGLIESENSSGEDFGTERLIQVAKANIGASPQVIGEAMMRAADQWSGSPEQADDMTVIVAHFFTPPRELQA